MVGQEGGGAKGGPATIWGRRSDRVQQVAGQLRWMRSKPSARLEGASGTDGWMTWPSGPSSVTCRRGGSRPESRRCGSRPGCRRRGLDQHAGGAGATGTSAWRRLTRLRRTRTLARPIVIATSGKSTAVTDAARNAQDKASSPHEEADSNSRMSRSAATHAGCGGSAGGGARGDIGPSARSRSRRGVSCRGRTGAGWPVELRAQTANGISGPVVRGRFCVRRRRRGRGLCRPGP